MLRRIAKVFVAGVVVCVFLQGCSIKHKSFSDVPPAPAGVSEELNERCHVTAVQASRDAVNELPTVGDDAVLLFGLLAGLAVVANVSAVRDSSYSNAYDKCLKGGEGGPERTVVIEDEEVQQNREEPTSDDEPYREKCTLGRAPTSDCI